MIRKFSRRARSYMLSYKALEIVGEEGREEGSGDEVDISLDITHKQIENMQKIIKSHRAALDEGTGDGNGDTSRTFIYLTIGVHTAEPSEVVDCCVFAHETKNFQSHA